MVAFRQGVLKAIGPHRVQAPVKRSLKQWKGFLLVQHPWSPLVAAVGHGTHDGDRDPQATLAESFVLDLSVLHRLVKNLLWARHGWSVCIEIGTAVSSVAL